jgi:hypothetical protein
VKQISSHFTTKSHNKKESLSPLCLFCPRVLTPTPERVAAAVAAPEEDIFTQQQRACVMCGFFFFFLKVKKRAFRSFAKEEEKKTSQNSLSQLVLIPIRKGDEARRLVGGGFNRNNFNNT